MSEEEKLQLENECLLKYSKAQMIQKYNAVVLKIK